MESTKPQSSAQFLAIPSRQCNRNEYDGQSLNKTELSLLEKAGSGNGVQCQLITDSIAKEHILAFVVQENSAQMRDEVFVAELKSWIRFNGNEVIRKGDGLYSVTSGNPNIPTWLGKIIYDFVFTARSENEKFAKLIRRAAGITIFLSEANDKAPWLEVFRCYQRFALQATTMDIRNSMLNQPVEVKLIRLLFAQHLGIGNRRPDLVVRFGRGIDSPQSLRRPVASVLL